MNVQSIQVISILSPSSSSVISVSPAESRAVMTKDEEEMVQHLNQVVIQRRLAEEQLAAEEAEARRRRRRRGEDGEGEDVERGEGEEGPEEEEEEEVGPSPAASSLTLSFIVDRSSVSP